MNRIEKVLAEIDLRATSGVEIGALTAPLVTADMGDIHYVDRSSRDDLVNWYSNNPAIDPTSIVPVHFVWGEQTLAECTGRTFGYCVSSHVIEHVPDLIGWIQEIEAILDDGGILGLIIPDKRYTFDILRRESNIVDAIDAYLQKLRKPSARQIFDHFRHYVSVDACAIWSESIDVRALKPEATASDTLERCRSFLNTKDYIDSHCWVFTPASFLQLLIGMSELGLVNFEVASLYDTEVNTFEFVISLRKLPAGLSPEERHRRMLASIPELPQRPAQVQEVVEKQPEMPGNWERRIMAQLSNDRWR